jgi:NTE family protein
MLRSHRQVLKAGKRLYEKLPPELRDDPDAIALAKGSCDPGITIVHLIYRQTRYESQSKDYNFSHVSVRDHWAAGGRDVELTLAHPDWQSYKPDRGKIQVFDLTNIDKNPPKHEPERKSA